MEKSVRQTIFDKTKELFCDFIHKTFKTIFFRSERALFSILMLLTLATLFSSKNALAQYPANLHCRAEGNMGEPIGGIYAWNDWFTNVTFAGINHNTIKGGWITRYTSETGSVQRGQTYTLSVTVNSDGAEFSYQHISAYIDWNRDGDCGTRVEEAVLDPGEGYVLGYGASHPATMTLNIVVPNDAALGTTWLRVMLDADEGSPTGGDYQGYVGYGEIKDFPLEITAGNSVPTDISLSATSINENVTANSTVGTLSTTDADASDTHTYSLVAGTGDTDNGAFNISGTDLRITNSPNYETKNSYSVRVQTSDGTATYSEVFTITINDVSEPPTVTTQAVGSILATTATGNGNITALGDPTPTQYGVIWDENANPTVALSTKTTQGAPGGTGAFTSSITGLSPNTTYHVRAYATNTAGTAYGDDVTFTTLTNGTFTGTASNDWGTAGNWAGGSVPTSATDVTIPAGKTAEITPGTSANCNNITIDPAGSLTIKSDATNAGSLIVSGTATGNVTYQSYLSETGKWHVVTAPVAGQNVWGFATLAGNSIAEKTGKRAVTEYIEATNTWDTNYPTADTEGSFAAGSGYSVLRSDAGVVSYTGTINTSDVSKPITRGLYGWNALGNPYTSAINATQTAHATNNLITANASKLDPVFAALYVWDAASGQYVTINNTGTGSLVQNYIQAGQGFFVRAKDNSGLNFSITEAMQTHQPSVPLKSAENTWPTILITAKSNNKLSSTMVTFNSQMTNGLDVTYDAGMFKADKNFALYSKLVDDNGNDFAIQALPEKFEGLIIPLGIDAPAGTEISFSAGTFNLPAEATVYLEDRASNRFTKLDATEAVYTVTITEQTKGAGNFYLHTSASTTGIEDQKNGIQVYTRDRVIFVNGNLDAKDVVALYGVDGKLHYKNIAGQNGLLRIDAAGLPAGVYLVSISQKAGRVTHKIILGE